MELGEGDVEGPGGRWAMGKGEGEEGVVCGWVGWRCGLWLGR